MRANPTVVFKADEVWVDGAMKVNRDCGALGSTFFPAGWSVDNEG